MVKVIHRSQSAQVQEKLNKWVSYLESGKKLIDCFTGKDGKLKEGFEISFYDYLELANSIGTQTFKIRFGLVNDDDGDPKFALFLWGEDKEANQTTPFLQVDYQDWITPPSILHIIYNGSGQGLPSTTIPALLAYDRLAAWNDAANDPDFSFADLFQLEQYKTGLQGYTYQRVDFVSILNGFNDFIKSEQQMRDLEKAFKVRLNFNCLSYNFEGKNFRNGYFDLLILAITKPASEPADAEKGDENSKTEIRGIFSDTGIPCPPLCGGGS